MNNKPPKPESRIESKMDHSASDPVAASGSRRREAVSVHIEKHHVDSRKINRRLKLDLCSICHRAVHKRAAEASADLSKPPPTLLHRLETILRMRGSLYIELGEAMRIEANEIEDLIAGLDEDLPRWRRLPESKAK